MSVFPINQQEKLLQKYQSQGPQVAEIAKQAFEMYCDTVNQANQNVAERFQAVWKSPERFIENAVEEESRTPGYLNSLVNKF
jgi:hypothetical protein